MFEFNWTVDLYSIRTGKLVETKFFKTRDMANIFIDARTAEGLWRIELR